MSYKLKNVTENKKAVVHLLCFSLLSNIASQLEETGPLNSSYSLACTAELTQSPLQLAITISNSLGVVFPPSLSSIVQNRKKFHFLAWVPLIFASKTWYLVTGTNLK